MEPMANRLVWPDQDEAGDEDSSESDDTLDIMINVVSLFVYDFDSIASEDFSRSKDSMLSCSKFWIFWRQGSGEQVLKTLKTNSSEDQHAEDSKDKVMLNEVLKTLKMKVLKIGFDPSKHASTHTCSEASED